MKELKPKLIITDSHKPKSGLLKFILIILIFSAGFCLGYITRDNPALEGYVKNILAGSSISNVINNRIDHIANYYGSGIPEKKEVSKTNIKENKYTYRPSYNKNNKGFKSSSKIVHRSINETPDKANYADEKYTLQVAAFETDKKAQDVVSDLLNKGYDAYSTISVNARGNKWHLIRIGIFTSYDEAYQYSEKLFKADGIISEIEILEPPTIIKLSNFDLE